MKQNALKSLRIASPCTVGWESMTGDERTRFCCQCNLHVYNIAELTQKEAVALITSTEGRICGRIYQRADGTVITKDCPIGLRALRRRATRIIGAVFATIVALSSAVLGQKPAKKGECKQQVTISRKQSDAEAGMVTGTILDPNGAVVPGARISIIERKSKKMAETTADDDGCFRIAVSGQGPYDLLVKSSGFDSLELPLLTVAAKETVTLRLILMPAAATVLIGVIGLTPMVDTSKPGGTTIITREMIDRLPIPR